MKSTNKSLRHLVMGALVAILVAGTAGASSAATLVNEINSPNGLESLSFALKPTGNTLTVNFAGYNGPDLDIAFYISLTDNGGPNLLGAPWNFLPAPSGSFAGAYSDGTSVPALFFGGVTVGSYDTFWQTISANPGDTYELTFEHQSFGGDANGFQVTTDALAVGGVPEPATWAMLIVGVGMIGLATRRRSATVAVAA